MGGVDLDRCSQRVACALEAGFEDKTADKRTYRASDVSAECEQREHRGSASLKAFGGKRDDAGPEKADAEPAERASEQRQQGKRRKYGGEIADDGYRTAGGEAPSR